MFSEESLSRMLTSLSSKFFLGTESKDSKSKILPKYLKWPPSGTAGMGPLFVRMTLGKICWCFPLKKAAPKDRHLSSLMSIFAQPHHDSNRRTKLWADCWSFAIIRASSAYCNQLHCWC